MHELLFKELQTGRQKHFLSEKLINRKPNKDGGCNGVKYFM